MKGFTLIEVLVSVTISTVVGLLLIILLVQNNTIFRHQTANVYQGISLNHSASILIDNIKSANFVAVAYPPQSPAYTSNTSNLVLALPSIDTNGNIIAQTYDYVVFYQDPLDLKMFWKKVFPDPLLSQRKAENFLMTNNLSQIIFEYFDEAGSIVSPASAKKVKFTIAQNEKQAFGQVETTTSSEINLRND